MPVPDLFAEGLARGWTTHDGSRLPHDLTLEADIAIVGSGAGGATSAEILSAAGFKVLLIEEGPLRTSRDFDMQEARAYRSLYQEAIGRTSKDGAITILQGRAVDGTTLVNWTSSFRTPPQTLAHWAREHGVRGLSAEALQPWFERMEQRLGVTPWAVPPNANNQVLKRGCERLDYHWAVIPRNVRGCWNLGYCGMGCPTNAKQSMLVTSIPALLDKGGELLYLIRAERLLMQGERVVGLDCLGMDERCVAPNGRRIRVIAKHYILAGGGINTPALLLRSDAPDPHKRVGKRTFLHLTNFSAARFDERINYFLLFPALLFSSLATAPLDNPALPRLAGAVLLGLGLAWTGLLIAKRLRGWSAGRFGAITQGVLRFNTYLGLAAVGSLFGKEGLALAALMLALMVPTVNVMSVWALTAERGVSVRGLLLPIARNPLILACLTGVLVNLSGLGLPGGTDRLLGLLAAASLPLGLLCVGAALKPQELGGEIPALGWNSAVRLLAVPLLAFGVARVLGLPDMETTILVLFFALPTAPTAYVLDPPAGR